MTITGRVLIVDDHEPSVRLIRYLLKREFPEIDVDAFYGSRSMNGVSYDLAVVDYGLKGETAIDVIEKFVDRTPTIIVTAYPIDLVKSKMNGHKIIQKDNGFSKELIRVAEEYLVKEQMVRSIDNIIDTYNRLFPPKKPTIVQKVREYLNGWRCRYQGAN